MANQKREDVAASDWLVRRAGKHRFKIPRRQNEYGSGSSPGITFKCWAGHFRPDHSHDRGFWGSEGLSLVLGPLLPRGVSVISGIVSL